MAKKRSRSEFKTADWATLVFIIGSVVLFTLITSGVIVQVFNIGIVFALSVLAPVVVLLPLTIGAAWGSRRWSRWSSVGPAAERSTND